MGFRKYRKRSTPAERAAAVALYESSGRSARSVAEELGVSVKTFETWVGRARREAVDPGKSMTADQRAQILRLQRENASLQREVDFLKKADAFFREQDQRERDSR